MQHGNKQSLGGMGADDLAAEPGIDQVRHSAYVIDVGVGQKQIMYVVYRNGKPVKGQLGIIAIC